MTNHRRAQRASRITFLTITALVLISLLTVILLAAGNQGGETSNAPSDELPSFSGGVSASDSYDISDVSNTSDIPDTPSIPDDSSDDTSSDIPQAPAFVIAQGTLNSEYACLFDRSTGAVIAVKNAYTKVAPASLTKMATAITVIEMCDDLDEMLTVSRDTVNEMYIEGASVVGFLAGEKATVTDMLYGLMLPSGADAAITLANRFGGTEKGFAELMNKKMQAIGLSDTHFVNVTGLDADEHYSTAADMARLLDYCLKNELFRAICTTEYYKITSPTMHEDGIELYNTAFSGFKRAGITNKYCLGGKTGTTDNAGRCLAALCSVDGEEYITVTIGARGTTGQGFVPADLNSLIEEVLPSCKAA